MDTAQVPPQNPVASPEAARPTSPAEPAPAAPEGPAVAAPELAASASVTGEAAPAPAAGATPADSTAPSPPAEAPSDDSLSDQDLRYRDANADRLVLVPTAETHPKGTFYFSAYELIFWQFGYAATDHFQVSLTTWPPIVDEQPIFFDLSGKFNVLRRPDWRLAVTFGSPFVSFDDEWVFVPRAGVIGQYCYTANCEGSVTLAVTGNMAVASQPSSNVPRLVTGHVGVLQRVSELLSLVLEVDTGAAAAASDFELADAILLDYALRISGRNFGVDVGFIRPIGEDVDTGLLLGLPWVSFTYRNY